MTKLQRHAFTLLLWLVGLFLIATEVESWRFVAGFLLCIWASNLENKK